MASSAGAGKNLNRLKQAASTVGTPMTTTPLPGQPPGSNKPKKQRMGATSTMSGYGLG